MSNNGSVASTFPQAPGLDQDLGSVGILLENSGGLDESQQIDFNDLYTPSETKSATPELPFSSQLAGGGDSGELTPVSVSSEFEYHHQQDSEGNDSHEHVEVESKPNPSASYNTCVYSTLNEEVIKKKFNSNIRRLGEEEDEEEKTITTMSMSQRESIVGFFGEPEAKSIETEKKPKW